MGVRPAPIGASCHHQDVEIMERFSIRTDQGISSLFYGLRYRSIGNRFFEHLRSAINPTAASYKDKPSGKHCVTEYPDHVGES